MKVAKLTVKDTHDCLDTKRSIMWKIWEHVMLAHGKKPGVLCLIAWWPPPLEFCSDANYFEVLPFNYVLCCTLPGVKIAFSGGQMCCNLVMCGVDGCSLSLHRP